MRRRSPGQRKACLAGGVALNCVANGRLLREEIFDEVWIQPASGDAGGAVGAALYGWHQIMGKTKVRPLRQGRNVLGLPRHPSFPDSEIETYLEVQGLSLRSAPRSSGASKASRSTHRRRACCWVVHGGVWSWPARHIGHRSIVGEPRVRPACSRP